MDRKKVISTFRKLHKWPGIIIAVFAVHFAFSGIVMNHRDLFSGVDISRKWMPGTYEYKNWNQAAVRGGFSLNHDSMLFFGNIGAWIKTQNGYVDFNQGFPKGIDNRKINQVILFKDKLVAATLFGLYQRGKLEAKWQAVPLPIVELRLIDLFLKQDTLMILSRNNLIKTFNLKDFQVINLPAPEGYTRSAGLFTTLWELLELGQIPQLPKVGRHRRVSRAAVLKYKRARDAQRESVLKDLAALSQRHRLGY